MAHSSNVSKLYQTVVEDVINNVREFFLDEGVDEQVLLELKQVWETKLQNSAALDKGPSEKEKLLQAGYAQQQKAAVQQKQQQQQQQQQQQLQQQQAVAAAAVKPAQPASQLAQAQTRPVSVAQFSTQLPIIQTATGAIEMSGAAQAATLALPAGLYQQQLAALQGGTITIQGQDGQQYILQTAPGRTAAVLQPQAAPAPAPAPAPATSNTPGVIQLDGPHDSSSDDEDDDDDGEDDKDDDDNDDANDEDNEEQGEEEEPLNSDDDVKEDDPSEIFETDNVVVCQFDKINRAKNRWKFHLKDGIMNLNRKDLVFQRATGDAEW